MGFSGGSVVKNLPANAGNPYLIPGLEDPLDKEMQPTSVSLPGKYHGHRNLGVTVHGVEKRWT